MFHDLAQFVSDSHKKSPDSIRKPLVMAYIGLDDPMRGDSRGAVGVARNVADILNGQYVYMDEAVLRDCFAHTEQVKAVLDRLATTARKSEKRNAYGQLLKAYVAVKGVPDVVIGNEAGIFSEIADKRPAVIENDYNEGYSMMRLNGNPLDMLSCHDLDDGILAMEKQKFIAHYPDIQTALIAVYLAEGFYIDTDNKAQKNLMRVLNNYDSAAVFLCPSRHTGSHSASYNEVMQYFHDNLHEGVRVIEQDYEDCKKHYNPYRGLIAAADHHVILGCSQSILSEVLSGGKMVFTDYGLWAPDLDTFGYIKRLEHYSDDKFEMRQITPPNITREVAQDIANEYLLRTGKKRLIKIGL